MGFLGALKSAALKTITVVTYPVVKPTEMLMGTIILNTLKSVLKGLAGTLVAALLAFAGVGPTALDPVTVTIWGLIINGVHALIALIQHSVAATTAAKAAAATTKSA